MRHSFGTAFKCVGALSRLRKLHLATVWVHREFFWDLEGLTALEELVVRLRHPPTQVTACALLCCSPL